VASGRDELLGPLEFGRKTARVLSREGLLELGQVVLLLFLDMLRQVAEQGFDRGVEVGV
jgi:hypothetical protein